MMLEAINYTLVVLQHSPARFLLIGQDARVVSMLDCAGVTVWSAAENDASIAAILSGPQP